VKKTLLIFGVTGGLGQKLIPYLEKDFDIRGVGSKDCNIVDIEQVNDVFTTFPATDYVLNLAVYNSDALITKQDPIETANQVLVNCQGTVNILSAALNHFRSANKQGKVILVSSVLMTEPVVGAGVYTGCKAFIEALGRQGHIEGKRYGVDVSTIRLGYCDAGLAHKIPTDKLKELTLGKGLIPPEQVADTIKRILEGNAESPLVLKCWPDRAS
jgi:NADP-dependent 3-hydroxy acid dehydrogenase YdfG